MSAIFTAIVLADNHTTSSKELFPLTKPTYKFIPHTAVWVSVLIIIFALAKNKIQKK